MNITLTPELEALVRQKVQTGLYSNASEVVSEALRLMEEKDRITRLQTAIAEGIAEAERGDTIEFTPEFVADALRRVSLMAQNGAHPDPDVCPWIHTLHSQSSH